MNKLYKISFVILLVVSLLTLTGCGSSGGGGSKEPTPQAISEMTGVRVSARTVIEHITDIIGFTPSSLRTSQNNIVISDKLQSVSNGEKINNLIPCNSRNEFFKGLGPNQENEWIQNSKYLKGSNNDSYNNLVVGTCDKYDGQRYIVALYEGKEGAGTILTKIVTMPSESAAVAISYINDGNGNESTFAFAVKKNGDFEGRTFKGHKNNVAYNSDGFESEVFYDNKTKQMTYANSETIEVIKLDDGSSISSSNPLIEGFKTSIYALKFGGQLRTGKDGDSNSAIIKENQLSQIPYVLIYIGDGSKLDKYMNYSTIDGFINDNDIVNKFMPKDLQDYEDARIGDYEGTTLDYYDGATAEATLRLALSVIDKDGAHIITKVAGQDNGLYMVAVSYLTINDKEYTVAVGAQMIRDSKGIFLEAKMFEGKHNDVNFQSKDNEKKNIKVIGTAKVEYVSETEIPGTITVNGKTVTFNAAE